MKASQKLIELIEHFEGLKLDAYLCPAKVPTIGFGSTLYEGGSCVKLGDKITKERAYSLLFNTLINYEDAVKSIVKSNINQNQFDSLVDFAYNAGIGALRSSTLLKKVNANPNDETIAFEFCKWVYGGDGSHNGKDDDGDGLVDEAGEKQKLNGLILRRGAEAALYFSK